MTPLAQSCPVCCRANWGCTRNLKRLCRCGSQIFAISFFSVFSCFLCFLLFFSCFPAVIGGSIRKHAKICVHHVCRIWILPSPYADAIHHHIRYGYVGSHTRSEANVFRRTLPAYRPAYDPRPTITLHGIPTPGVQETGFSADGQLTPALRSLLLTWAALGKYLLGRNEDAALRPSFMTAYAGTGRVVVSNLEER